MSGNVKYEKDKRDIGKLRYGLCWESSGVLVLFGLIPQIIQNSETRTKICVPKLRFFISKSTDIVIFESIYTSV